MNRIFKRKLYGRLLQWKNTRKGKTAILVEGARRVGKSTLVKDFAQKEYENIKDTVEILKIIKPVYNFKASE